MSRTFRSITGTFDILPDSYRIDDALIAGTPGWRHVEAVIHEVLGRYGAEEIRTPVFEPTEMIARGVGQLTDIVSKEMFAFERGDTRYVLRPELTAPVMRSYLQHSLDQRGGVQRLYYIGPCFRAERPQRGRYRQFHQFGVEVIGADGPVADVEVIAMMVSVYAELGITNTSLRLNTLGDAESRPKYREALTAYLTPYANDLSETSRQRLENNPLRILDTKNPDERKLLENAPRLIDFVDAESLAHYASVQARLNDLDIPFVEDPFLVRGLDYYTRTAFELESSDLGAQSALAGGGRYDLLSMEIGSRKPIPAVGFAAGLERLFLALDAAGVAIPTGPVPDIFFVALGEAAADRAVVESDRLRAAGLRVVTDLLGRSMKAQMREANRLNARFVLILGSDELAAGQVMLRTMEDSSQELIPLAGLAETIRQRIDRRSGA